MSNEDKIRKWKGGKSSVSEQDAPQGADAEANPAGDTALEDAELESVAGGNGEFDGTESAASIGCCTSIFCKPPS